LESESDRLRITLAPKLAAHPAAFPTLTVNQLTAMHHGKTTIYLSKGLQV